MKRRKEVTSMEEKTYHFERLTPIDNVDLEVYGEALDYVFANSDIRNVAISGAYSAGKSSVLASYKKKHSDLRFLHISLAHFKSPDQEDEADVKESVLEGKILNQLIHQIPSEKIPQTNFRVKKKIGFKSVLMMTVEIVLLFIAVAYFASFDMWTSYVNILPDNWFKSILIPFTHQYALIVDGIIIVILLSFIVYWGIRVQKNKNIFRKLNLQGNEIEIFEESDDSYFDKYLNEVLYLFENAEADVIVFEDMDRFNANKIFERLREVNTLANIQLQKEGSKTVLRFFYLLRDDIFISKDRTKFFDYIVPIVPVVDSSNSYDQFISHFKKCGIFEKFDESFLQGLSLYIDDMRLLKNIYNEFVVYFNRLNITELDCNKMLAIISYKNLFPRDFADLQLNQGFVYTLFRKKDNFIENEIKEMKNAVNEKQQRIASSESEHVMSIRELNAVFADKYLRYYSWNNLNNEALSDFVTNHLSGDGKREYMNRKQVLDDKLTANSSKLHQEINALEKKIIDIKNKQFHQIITRTNIDTIFSITSTNEIGDVTDFNEIKRSEYFDLLKYLIRNGFIDETYADYMTYFYENSLSRIDKTFLRSVTDKKSKEYTYRLKNPRLVLSRLRLVDFDQEEILNFDLLTYLLQMPSHIDYLDRFLDQLRETRNFKFIGAYFEVTTEMPAYIKHLNIIWSELFAMAFGERLLTENQIRSYSIFSLYYSDDEVIGLINKDNCLCDYISNARDYLAIDKPDIDKLIHGFSLLGVLFTGFDYTNLNKDLFEAVYEKSLYKLNADNLRLFETEILGEKNNEDILHKNYTLLCSHLDSAITQYVNQNINEYFDVVLQMSEGIIRDDENVAVTVLNNSELATKYKEAYTSALRTTITSIKEIVDSSLWAALLDADIVKYSESNIMDCFNALKLNKSVIAYINRCNIDLDFLKTEYGDDEKEKLFNSVIRCNDIDNTKYKQILVSLELVQDNFDLVEIADDKVTILIDTDIIRMTVDNLKFIRDNYLNHRYYFVQKNIEKYIELMDNTLFLQEELLEILTWEISDELKIELLEFSNEKISIINKNYSPAVCLYILKYNFSDSDLLDLFSSYEQWDNSIQEKIFDYAVENMETIIDSSLTVSGSLKNNLFHSDRVTRNEKIDLLIAIMPELSEDKRKDILAILKLTEYIKIFDGHSRPKFKVNDENEKLLTAFKENHLIDSYRENSEKAGYYKIVRVKPSKRELPKELL